jgi:hypothetical protein
VGVACHIFKHLLGLFDRITHIDYPVFGPRYAKWQ